MKIKLLAFILLSFIQRGKAQNGSLYNYQQIVSIPHFRLASPDSTWITPEQLPKDKKVIIMLFSPECDHCKKQTQLLLNHSDQLQEVQIIMATTLPFDKISQFITEMKLDRAPNFRVGRDQGMFLGLFYKLQQVPLLAVYNRKHELVSVFDGGAKWNQLLQALQKP